MNKAFCLLLISSLFVTSDYGYTGSTTASVTLAGGIIKATHSQSEKKYRRKDCPVCKGKGWYISGDGIKEVDCGYCEEETKDSEVTHPPVLLESDCKTKVYKK